MLETHRGPAESILERELFGWDHCEVGQNLIAAWKLPAEFDAAAFTHRQWDAQPDWDLAQMVFVSCRMAGLAGYPEFVGCETEPFPDLLELLPTRERTSFDSDLEQLTGEIADGIHAIDSL